MNVPPDSASSFRRALVLGGGGSAGNAWLLGVLGGLAGSGLDVTGADLTIGTSAGATATAQLTASSAEELLQAILDAPVPDGAAPRRPALQGTRPAVNGMELSGRIIAEASDAAAMRKGMGAASSTLDAGDGAGQARWRTVVAGRLPGAHWPARRLMITAIDADSGEPAVFDNDSGVDLVDAVAASTSNGFGVGPYPIGGHRYLDGGYRRNENADLAIGAEKVLVLSPLGGRTRHPLQWRMQLSAHVEDLEAAGSLVETILPGAASLEAMGANLMDLCARRPSAIAGAAQGRALAPRLADFWG